MKNGKSTNSQSSIHWITWIILAIALYAGVVGTLNLVSSSKIGYIDSSVLLQKYEGAVEARNTLTKETEEWGKNIKTLETELNQLNQEFIDSSAKWNKSTVASKKATLEKKQQDYVRYSRAVSEKAAKREQELMQPVYDELNVQIKDFGKKYGYDMLLGTIQGGNILYGEESTDVTEAFLEYVKEN